MKKVKDTFLNNTKKRILYIISAFFLMYLVSYIIDPYSIYWREFFTRDISLILQDFAVTLACSLSISEFSIFISSRLNRALPWMEFPARRLISEAVLNILMLLFINFLVAIFFFGKGNGTDVVVGFHLSVEEAKGLMHWIAVSAAITLMIMSINTGNYLILNWKNAALRAAELNQVAMEAELQSLKLQIDPHFVFNNLSVLSELILEDQQLGYEYAENFSKIYRYMLVSSKKDVILLEDELKFLNAYIFLIEHRIGEGVHFQIEVEKASRYLFLPPMTLQLLVENALKHNRTSKKEPLHIRIYTTEKDELFVENTVLPIEKPIDSSGIGIKNINRRYGLLSDRAPKITNDGNHFIVNLPLLKV